MRLLADTNIVAMAVRGLRALGHEVAYVAERDADPGDLAIFSVAINSGIVFLAKGHDIAALVIKNRQNCAGVLLIDDHGFVGSWRHGGSGSPLVDLFAQENAASRAADTAYLWIEKSLWIMRMKAFESR